MKYPVRGLRTTAVFLATTSLAFAQWIQRTPGTSPTARTGAAMDFVPQNLGLVMFGGGAPLNSNQTWVYDGTAWTQLSPAVSPTARFGHEMVYDVLRGVAVIYGGLASNISIPPPNSDTWEWNGLTWTPVSTANNPGPLYKYGACYDLIRSKMVIFGGATSQLLLPPSSQTWEYDGVNWTQVTTVGNPGGRERPAMCFDIALGKAVMFGGYDGFNLTDQTWLYDGALGTWTQATISGPKPSARNAARMVYDPVRNLCVLTGGQDAVGPLADTWVFDGVNWIQQPSTTQAARDHMFAFLPTSSVAVKFGGFVAAPNTTSNQTWETGGGVFGFGCPGTNGVPTFSASAPPRAGQPWSATITNLEPTYNIAVILIGFGQLPGIDLSFLPMPGCALYTTIDLNTPIMGAGGSATWSFAAVPNILGGVFYAQAWCYDPTVNGFGGTLSNAIYGTIVN